MAFSDKELCRAYMRVSTSAVLRLPSFFLSGDHMINRLVLLGILATLTGLAHAADAPAGAAPAVTRIGIIGLDTSHVGAFIKIFNDPKATGDFVGMHIVAAYPGGSKDIESSYSRVGKFTEDTRKAGVEIVDTIPALLEKVDAVLLESVDGRPHLEQVKPVLAAHKPVFIDKPLAGSLEDAVAIVELGNKYHTPWFSSSSLRFGPTIQAAKHDPKIGDIVGCITWSPAPLEKTHPDLYWYGIHGVEMLYTLMGKGCDTVTRVNTPEADVVTGHWKDGRLATFRGNRAGAHDYGWIAIGSKNTAMNGKFEGYKPLDEQIATFFKTKVAPIDPAETLEMMAFMEAADESKRQNGATIKIADVMAKAEAAAKAKIADTK